MISRRVLPVGIAAVVISLHEADAKKKKKRKKKKKVIDNRSSNLEIGRFCSENENCLSGFCVEGKCRRQATCSAAGGPCIDAFDCCNAVGQFCGELLGTFVCTT